MPNQKPTKKLNKLIEEKTSQFFNDIKDTTAQGDFIGHCIILGYKMGKSQMLQSLRKEIWKKRHYDLEEFDHDSKMMSVGFNQALSQVIKLIEEYGK